MLVCVPSGHKTSVRWSPAVSGRSSGDVPGVPGVDLLADIEPAWWDDSDYARREYVGPAPTDDVIASVEGEPGYRLPGSYVAMMRRHNGGLPRRTCFPTSTRTTWADDHVAVTGIFGIGRDVRYSLCGEAGSRFWIQAWGYPDLGVYFASCPSGRSRHDRDGLPRCRS